MVGAREEASGIQSLNDDEAVDVGLCFGWISGQRKWLEARDAQLRRAIAALEGERPRGRAGRSD